jgi:hypothetical protein
LLAYAAWEGALDRRTEDGRTERVHLESVARRGHKESIARLTEPYFPEALDYLWVWLKQLRRGLGEGMHGLALLTWTTFDAWCRRMQVNPEPHEVDALFSLDAVLRNPDAWTAD